MPHFEEIYEGIISTPEGRRKAAKHLATHLRNHPIASEQMRNWTIKLLESFQDEVVAEIEEP